MKWTETDDKVNFNDLSVECNMGSWQGMKDLYSANDREDAFYIKTTGYQDDTASLNIEQAKELVKYLMQKIEYVEGLTYESFNDL